ncbi:MAG: polysaccharide pyruvyl transferase family protein [Candidatus Omnitrophica bacterium]|nr:polysaccharide pyruvyl transferase family protein [Candidatus Omnitrophota bacterium]MDD5552964.1 polysaccharide pyruvyl transferase family protein [Candidatus Omnitrophota bacterium]
MKVLIFEAYTDANVGSASLIENACNIVRSAFKDASISILAQNKEAVGRFSGLPVFSEIFILPLNKGRLSQAWWFVVNLFWMAADAFSRISRLRAPCGFYTLSREKKRALKAIRESDVVFGIGAERINDNFFLALPFSLYSIWLVKSYNKKLILLPQTIGPFYFSVSKFFARKALLLCDRIYTRDKRSLDVLKSLKIPEWKFKFVPDMALLQKTAPAEAISRIRLKEGIPQGVRFAGVSALKWSYFKSNGNYAQYKEIMAKACDYLSGEKDYHVIFMPTNVKVHGCREDDIATAAEIHGLMKNKTRASLVTSLYTPAEIKGLCGLMDIFIATRMHACILATSAFVPTIAINYQFKLYEYMKLLGLEYYSLDIGELDFGVLRSLMDDLCLYKERLRPHLQRQIAILGSRVHNTLSADLKDITINDHGKP